MQKLKKKKNCSKWSCMQTLSLTNHPSLPVTDTHTDTNVHATTYYPISPVTDTQPLTYTEANTHTHVHRHFAKLFLGYLSCTIFMKKMPAEN